MTLDLWSLIAAFVLFLALLATPIGLPGNWIMVAVLAVSAVAGRVGAFTVIAAIALAGLAELAEFFVVQKLNVRYGGSRRAFWGAILGGIAGVMMGMPVPIIGSVIAGFIGSFVGAAIVTLFETRAYNTAARVGWGVLLGRMLAAAAKTGAGVVILVLGVAALVLR